LLSVCSFNNAPPLLFTEHKLHPPGLGIDSWANYWLKCNLITNYFGIIGQITNYVISITLITN